MSSSEQVDTEIESLIEWGPPDVWGRVLAALFGSAICAGIGLGIAALGGHWFLLDRTQQSIVFAGSFIALGRSLDAQHFPSVAHVAMAIKALVLATQRRSD